MFSTYVGKPLPQVKPAHPTTTTKSWGNALQSFYNRLMIILCGSAALTIVGVIIF